jgi:hypothetical protein
MSTGESNKPQLEKIKSSREWIESMFELDLCGPIKEKLGRDTCKPDIVIKPCQPIETSACSPRIICSPSFGCFPDKIICNPEILCSPTFSCFPDKIICKPDILCSPSFGCLPDRICKPIYYGEANVSGTPGPTVDLPTDRLDEIVKAVNSIKEEIAEIKKKIARK